MTEVRLEDRVAAHKTRKRKCNPSPDHATADKNSNWLQIGSAEVKSLQGADPDIAVLIELRQKHKTKPSWGEVMTLSPEVKTYWAQWGRLVDQEGLLYRRSKDTDRGMSRLQLVTPLSLRTTFFKALHHGRLAGHQGVNKTLANLKQRYYWPCMKDDVTAWCARCHICGETKPLPKRGKAGLQQSFIGAPFERVAIDLMGPFEETNHNKYIVVLQDYFTKYVIAEPLPNKMAQTVADVVYTRWITKHGAPLRLHSDQGREFTADLFKEMCMLLRVDKTYTTAYRPQSDGLVERTNRSLQSMLKATANQARDTWDEDLPAVTCAYCATPHESTGVSPYRMLYGREMTMPIDLQVDTGLKDEASPCQTAYVQWLKSSLQRGHELARQQLGKSAKRQKKTYEERVRDVQFTRGDWVWRAYPSLLPGKLRKKNIGPWLVLARKGEVTYLIQRNSTSEPTVVHVDKLSRYNPDFGETLENWIQDDEPPEEVATQTPQEWEMTTTPWRDDPIQVEGPTDVHEIMTNDEASPEDQVMEDERPEAPTGGQSVMPQPNQPRRRVTRGGQRRPMTPPPRPRRETRPPLRLDLGDPRTWTTQCRVIARSLVPWAWSWPWPLGDDLLTPVDL
jgi:hypothetical protein